MAYAFTLSWKYPFSKLLLAKVFNILTNEQIDKDADYVKYDSKGQIHMLKREYTLQSIMDVVCNWCEVSSFPYKYNVNDNNNNTADIYTIRFDMGTKWSML
jgi:hypothetical protein